MDLLGSTSSEVWKVSLLKRSDCGQWWFSRRHASKRHLIVVVLLRIPAKSGMLWVQCGCHQGNRLLNMVSAFQQSWKRGKLNMYALLLRPVSLLDIVVIFSLQEREKRRCLRVQLSCNVSLKFQVLLPVPENALWSMIPRLRLLWRLSLYRGKTRKSGRDRKAVPVFQGGIP